MKTKYKKYDNKLKEKYVIKGTIKGEIFYFIGFENQFMWGSEWSVRNCARRIEDATKYTNIGNAIKHCERLGGDFKIYPVCPICKNEYSEYPALSRKDNKTKICPSCGVKEALDIYIKKTEI